MNSDRMEGTARSAAGKLEEGVGRATGDMKTQLEGMANQAKGAVQDAYGQVRETAADAANRVQRGAGSLEEALRESIEAKPYTAVAIALALGWFIGRLGRTY
jgi:uncharacterized protein YjbJ (UPF0337 family)